MKKLLFFSLFFFLFSPNVFGEAELLVDKVTTMKAEVLEVINETKEKIVGTDVYGIIQSLEIKIIDGVEKGKILTLQNDYNNYNKGDVVYVTHNIRAEDGFETYIISDSYRLPILLYFGIFFVLLVVFVGGRQGVRGMLSLFGSLLLIVFVLLPSIMSGFSPILASVFVSSIIIVLGSYVTHGFNKTTSSAVYGMILTVIITGFLAYVAVYSAKLTGFESEEVVYLNFNLKGNIDIVGILLGGIMIGLLGVLYDVAIGQSIAVEELHSIAPHVGRYKIYKRAIRMGREHIGALVNTLAIAYVGAALPLLLLFSNSSLSPLEIMNREIFATEIVRTLVGSIGLVLAVPITTLLAAIMLVKTNKGVDKDIIEKEEESMNHIHHKH